jgi:hypothetical protein
VTGPQVQTLGYAPDHPGWAAVWPALGGDLAQIVADAARHNIALDAVITADQMWLHTNQQSLLTLHGPHTPGLAHRWLHETAQTSGVPYGPWLAAAMLHIHLVAPACTRLGSDTDWDRGWLPARRICSRRFDPVPDTSPLVQPADAFAGIQL